LKNLLGKYLTGWILAAHLVSALHPSVFARLAYRSFYEAIVPVTSYEIIKFGIPLADDFILLYAISLVSGVRGDSHGAFYATFRFIHAFTPCGGSFAVSIYYLLLATWALRLIPFWGSNPFPFFV
jgi:hypothetical protein